MSIGYKCFNRNLQCRKFQYEVGKTYIHDGNIEMCASGFHFCVKPADVFNYYDFDINNRVCIIEFDENNVIHGDDKSVTGKITIVKELSWNEVLEFVNTGKRNTGIHNSGDKNSGDWNSGDKNSGNLNSGNLNSGNWNSGDWNSGDWNSGIFCSESPNIRIFNKQTEITISEFYNSDEYFNIRAVLYDYELPLTYWLSFANMTEEEVETYKQYECQGGVLLHRDYKTACELWWKSIPNSLKEEFINWEYFNADVFEQITGVKVGAKDHE